MHQHPLSLKAQDYDLSTLERLTALTFTPTAEGFSFQSGTATHHMRNDLSTPEADYGNHLASIILSEHILLNTPGATQEFTPAPLRYKQLSVKVTKRHRMHLELKQAGINPPEDATLYVVDRPHHPHGISGTRHESYDPLTALYCALTGQPTPEQRTMTEKGLDRTQGLNANLTDPDSRVHLYVDVALTIGNAPACEDPETLKCPACGALHALTSRTVHCQCGTQLQGYLRFTPNGINGYFRSKNAHN